MNDYTPQNWEPKVGRALVYISVTLCVLVIIAQIAMKVHP